MKAALSLLLASALLAGAWVPAAHADTLQMQVRDEAHMHLPHNGMTAAQVLRQFGKPESKLPVRGGGSRWQPPIHRWVYPGYIVYFEHHHVIHAVADAPRGDHPVR